MLDFMAKIQQIRFRLGLRPRPRWGSLQRSSRPLSGLRAPISKAREGGKRRKWERRKKGKGRKGKGRKGEGREGKGG